MGYQIDFQKTRLSFIPLCEGANGDLLFEQRSCQCTVWFSGAQESHEACVIPPILCPTHWHGLLGCLQALPTNAKPVIDRYWHNKDEAWYDSRLD